MVRAFAISLSLAVLTGCAALPPALQLLSVAGAGMSFVTTGKGVGDHLMSAALDRDCVMLRFVQGEDPCREQTPAEDSVQTVANIDAEQDISLLRGQTLDIDPAAVGAALARPNLYLVIGSFSDRFNAEAFSRAYSDYNTGVSLETGETVAYRVVVGPIPAGNMVVFREDLYQAGISETWPIPLCGNDLTPPPCSELLAAVDTFPDTSAASIEAE